MSADPREAIRSELLGQEYGTGKNANHHAALMHAGGPQSLQHTAYTLQDKVSHAAREVTLWLPGRSLDSPEVKAALQNWERKDTNLGHSINAEAFARAAYQVAARIAASLNVDIRDIR